MSKVCFYPSCNSNSTTAHSMFFVPIQDNKCLSSCDAHIELCKKELYKRVYKKCHGYSGHCNVDIFNDGSIVYCDKCRHDKHIEESNYRSHL